MKKIFIFFIIIAFLSSSIPSAHAYVLMPEYLCELGLNFYHQGRIAEALYEFKKALIINPGYEPALKYINIIQELPVVTVPPAISPAVPPVEKPPILRLSVKTRKEEIEEMLDKIEKEITPSVTPSAGLPKLKKKNITPPKVLLLFADKKESPISVLSHVTYGDYSGSAQRERIISETLNISYIPSPNYGLSFNVYNSKLDRKSPLEDIDTTIPSLSYFMFFKLNTDDCLGGRISVLNVQSDDKNSDGTTIPYLSFIYKTPDAAKYIDMGYTHMDYDDAAARQVTLTGGIALFNQWVWSQTRLYYIDLSKKVQDKSSTFAVEERLTYYAIPKKLTLTLYGLLGQRIYAYDPDLGIAYGLPDIQKGSVGLTIAYNFTKALSIYGDVTYEKYKNKTINDNYNVIYETLGLKYSF